MYQTTSTSSERLGEIISRVASLVTRMSVWFKLSKLRKCTYEATKRVLQSSTSSVANTRLQLVDILLVACRDFLDVALGKVACFVLAHGVEGFLFHLALEPGWDAEPGWKLACGS